MAKKGLYGVNTYRERSKKKIGRHKKNLNKSQKPYKKYRGQGRQGVDKCPILTYIYRMKGKKVTLSAKGASIKQWTDLMLELNLMKKSWHRYGVDIDIQTPGITKIISWGTRKYDAKDQWSKKQY